MPSADQTDGSRSRNQGDLARLPGGWQAALIAALSALLAGYLGRPGHDLPPAGGRLDVSRIAEVTPDDLPAALGTVSGTPQQLAEMAKPASCSRRLAWITVARAPGGLPGRIRLRSGGYVSPAFDLMDAPVRIAIPFPALYPTGHGAISVLGTTTDAIVALVPSWNVPAQAGTEIREVTWTPLAGCPAART